MDHPRRIGKNKEEGFCQDRRNNKDCPVAASSITQGQIGQEGQHEEGPRGAFVVDARQGGWCAEPCSESTPVVCHPPESALSPAVPPISPRLGSCCGPGPAGTRTVGNYHGGASPPTNRRA